VYDNAAISLAANDDTIYGSSAQRRHEHFSSIWASKQILPLNQTKVLNSQVYTRYDTVRYCLFNVIGGFKGRGWRRSPSPPSPRKERKNKMNENLKPEE